MNQHLVSILGDSYSTFSGCIPEGNYVYYPHEGIENVKSAEDTWWYQLLERRGLHLLINDSSSGTTVSNRVREHHTVKDSFINRMKRSLSDDGINGEKPGLILLFGGTNDCWIDNDVGTLQFSDWTEESLFSVLPAYCYMLDYVKKNNPNARIVGVINCDLKAEIMQGMAAACRHYGVQSVQLHDIHKVNKHPDQLGMRQICDQLDAALDERA